MQAHEIHEMLAYAACRWPRTFVLPTSAEQLALTEMIWHRQVGDLDLDLLTAAMDMWQEHWPPDAGELRLAALRLRAEVTGQRIPDLDEAWTEFIRDYKLDYRGDHIWSHPVVANAARALNPRDYGQSMTADQATWRAQFRGFYETARTRFETSGAAPPGVLEYSSRVVEELASKLRLPELEPGDDASL